MTEWVSSDSPVTSVTLCAILRIDLTEFAKRISTDFFDFGGVEQGPDARMCCSEPLFRNSGFSQFLSSLSVLGSPGVFPGGSKRCRAASKEVLGGQGKPRAPERWSESSRRGLGDRTGETKLSR